MITYRTATIFDVPVLVSLERSIFKDDPWSAGQFKEEIAGIGQSRYYIVAESDGQIIGYAGILFVSAGMEADILTLAVIPEFRRKGLGRAMLHDLMAWARGKGANAFMLEVRVKNDDAIGLYESEGFSKVGHRNNYYGPGKDATVMRKEER